MGLVTEQSEGPLWKPRTPILGPRPERGRFIGIKSRTRGSEREDLQDPNPAPKAKRGRVTGIKSSPCPTPIIFAQCQPQGHLSLEPLEASIALANKRLHILKHRLSPIILRGVQTAAGKRSHNMKRKHALRLVAKLTHGYSWYVSGSEGFPNCSTALLAPNSSTSVGTPDRFNSTDPFFQCARATK